MRRHSYSVHGQELAPPENQAHYMTKPLPAPPIPKRNLSRNSTRSPPRPVATRSVIAPSQSLEHLSTTSVPPTPPRRSASRSSRRSMPTSPIAERRSSLKVSQLTGHSVGICFDWNPTTGFSNYASPVYLADDNSSNYCHSLDDAIYEEDEGLWSGCSVPTLISDCDDDVRKRSSDGPVSPHSIQASALRAFERELYGFAPDSPRPVGSDEFDSMTNSYNYFSDNETADEYHRFTTNLAKSDKQRGRDVTAAAPRISRSQSLTRRLSVSARSLFARRRDPPRSVCTTTRSSIETPRSQPDLDVFAQVPHISRSDKSSLNSPCLSGLPDDASFKTHSLSEYSGGEDTDDEENHMREVIREFFTEARGMEAKTLNRKTRRPNLRANIHAIPE